MTEPRSQPMNPPPSDASATPAASSDVEAIRANVRTSIRANIAAQCYVARLSQANGVSTTPEERRKSAAHNAVADADALLAALG